MRRTKRKLHRVFMFDRVEAIERNLQRLLDSWQRPARSSRRVLPFDRDTLLELFDTQATVRQLDIAARRLRADGHAYYTISSAGHEGNGVVGRLTRATDPALLHYRSGAFVAERYRKQPELDFVRDTLLSLVAGRDEPISGGRHKVWGSRPLWIPPQTSTIASHLPKAFGAAMALGRARRMRRELPVPADSIVVCSFGDASFNHSTAQGALNAATYAARQRLPVPLLLVCEDNGLGISVPTPPDWIAQSVAGRSGLRYFAADGTDLACAWPVVERAVDECRRRRVPTFVHLKVVRLLGHAGSDLEAAYHTIDQIETAEAHDPLLCTARLVLEAGGLSPGQLAARYSEIADAVSAAAAQIAGSPQLASAEEITTSLAPYHPDLVRAEAQRAGSGEDRRRELFSELEVLAERGPPKHLAVQINRALRELMEKYPQMVVFGEDVARKGGVYHVTANLLKRFGAGRVFNTLLDEQTILGLAQGFAAMGLLPFAEIQYLAYLHNAIDQLRGEACSQQFFSRDQFRNPMVLRIASFAYQKGFGGHFHNDNAIGALREIPSLIIGAPARGDDAVGMLRTAAALAHCDGRVVAMLEPIALYMTRDLHERGDDGWTTRYPAVGEAVELGRGRVYHIEHTQLSIISYANGVYLALRAAHRLRQRGIAARVVDLRWLQPLDEALIRQQAEQCDHLMIVDECRRSGGVGEAILAILAESGSALPPLRRIAAADSYIPLGPPAELLLPSEQQIFDSALALCAR